MNKKVIILFFTLALTTSDTFSQNIRIDSLSQLLEASIHDTTMINTLNELSWEFHRNDIEKSFDFATRALEVSQRVGFKKGEARAYNLQAIIYSFKGSRDLSIEANLKSLEISKSINSLSNISSATNDLGLTYAEMSDNKKAMDYYRESLEASEKIKDTLGVCFTLSNIGGIHLIEGNLDIAQSYFQKAADIGIYAKDSIVLSSAFMSLGDLELHKKEYEKARGYFEQALSIAEKSGDLLTVGEMTLALGDVSFMEKKYELAELQYLDGLDIIKKLGIKERLMFPYIALTDVYFQQKEYEKGLDYSKRGLAIAKEINDKNFQASFYYHLSKNYEAQGQIKKAFEAHKVLKTMDDSLYTIAKSDQVLEMEAKYQVKQKEIENKFLTEEKIKNEALLRQQSIINYSVFFGLLSVSVIAFLLWRSFKKKQSYSILLEKQVKNRTEDLLDANHRLKVSNGELEKFAYIASHDLKEPLRNISGFSKLIERALRNTDKPKVHEYISFVQENTKQMYTLIEDVLEYSRLNANEEMKEVDVNLVIDKVKKLLEDTIKEKNVILFVDQLPEILGKEVQLFQIFKNLIENGIKYNKSEVPTIQIKYQKEAEFECFKVSDNGIGIDPEYHQQIFGMFKRLHNRSEYKGSGLGLSIVKRNIEIMGGQITVESSQGNGSQFIIKLPRIDKKLLKLKKTESIEYL